VIPLAGECPNSRMGKWNRRAVVTYDTWFCENQAFTFPKNLFLMEQTDCNPFKMRAVGEKKFFQKKA